MDLLGGAHGDAPGVGAALCRRRLDLQGAKTKTRRENGKKKRRKKKGRKTVFVM